jgi:hypothetical protein
VRHAHRLCAKSGYIKVNTFGIPLRREADARAMSTERTLINARTTKDKNKIKINS